MNENFSIEKQHLYNMPHKVHSVNGKIKIILVEILFFLVKMQIYIFFPLAYNGKEDYILTEVINHQHRRGGAKVNESKQYAG